MRAGKAAAVWAPAFAPTLIDNGDEVIVKNSIVSKRYFTHRAPPAKFGSRLRTPKLRPRKDAAEAEAHKLDKYR